MTHSKLQTIYCESIYGRGTPAHMSKLHEDVVSSFYRICERVKALGGEIVISDMFRSHLMQVKLRAEKPKLAAPPGRSYHEAGLAFDIDVSRQIIGFRHLEAIMNSEGWTTIKGEHWHWQHSFRVLGYKSLGEAIRDVRQEK